VATLLPRRIYGIETEYGITCSLKDHRRLTPDELSRYMFRDIVAEFRSSNVFLPNGGRLYLDVGSHPEYATAECDSLTDLLAQELAGDSLVNDLGRKAEQILATEEIEATVFVFKNNTDSTGNSYGCHENYLIHRKLDYLSHLDGLLPFLVTRQLFCGAGKILQTSEGFVFSLSQRADHMWDAVSSATTRSRPMINTRDEPHADADKYRRLHVISGDSNMSEISMLLKTATMDLVLAVMEIGGIPSDLRVDNPMKAIRDVSRDITGSAQVRLLDGRTMTAVAVQRFYYELVQRNLAKYEWEISALHQLALHWWDKALTAFELGDFSTLSRTIDWSIKLNLLRAYQERDDIEFGSPKLAQIDLMYHELSSERGIFQLLKAQNRIDTVINAAQWQSARSTPPATTRAKLRGAFVAAASGGRANVAVDWMHLKINTPVERAVVCSDPFTSLDERVDDLLAILKN
jgi:proteasome accessory factor A